MSGTEKVKLLVTDKSKKPPCFKRVKSLKVDYEANQKARMTTPIFGKWLFDFDKEIIKQKRKVVLFVDNCPAHPHAAKNKTKNVKLGPPPLRMKSPNCNRSTKA